MFDFSKKKENEDKEKNQEQAQSNIYEPVNNSSFKEVADNQEETTLEKEEQQSKAPVLGAKTKIISIFSPKGGAGKTLVTVNTGVSLAQLGKKVLILDFDLKAPLDIAQTLNIKMKHSLCDVVPYLKNHNALVVDKMLDERIHRYSDNLHYLPAISKISQMPHIKESIIKKIIPCLRKDYDFIVLDAGTELTDVLIKLFDNSNLIAMLVTPDVLSVYKTEWCLDTLQSLHFPLSMIKLVLNRAETKGSFSWQEMKMHMPCDIIGMVPSDGKAVNYSLNRQVPVVLDAPDSKFSLAIKEIAKHLVDNDMLYVEQSADDRSRQHEAMAQSQSTFWQKQGLVDEIGREEAKQDDEIVKLKQIIHKRLVNELNLQNVSQEVFAMKGDKYQKLRESVERLITNILAEETGKFISSLEVRKKLTRELVDEALGFGPLEDLIKDPSVTEIMVNNQDQIFIEVSGKLIMTTKKFVSNAQIRTVIDRIIAPLGRRIDESTPMVDARLPDGSRVNAIIPPLALNGPTLTIRKFSKKKLTMDELVDEFGSLDANMAKFLEAAVISRKNIIVSGGTDSGKTTFLNILSECIPEGERVITIEDAAEIKLHHSHWIRLESRPPNIEGKGAVTLRDLFKNTLRMRPDRIVVGEVRGAEVIDMLQAMNTGHDGSMSTVHANSPQDVMTRLDSLMLMSGVDIPLRAIREMIASALDIIVQTAKFPDGKRRVTKITEVLDVGEDMRVLMQDIFEFKQTHVDEDGLFLGDFAATGVVPLCLDELSRRGLKVSKDWFKAPELPAE